MKNYKQQFKSKKITIMGLGLLGRGLGYTRFLAECGAILTVTDLKTKDQLKSSLAKLKKFKNIKYVLGEHRLEDFKDKDMIIKAPGVPLDSIYIQEGRRNKIPIEMDVSLFAKSAPGPTIIGVTGTRGKSMTTMLIYEILKSNKKLLKRDVYLGGNIRGVATLPLLEKFSQGDILVCELDSWQLQGFGEAGISPAVSVFTTFMPDHMNYYKDDMSKYFKDKANIFKYQKSGDTLIVLPEVKKIITEKKYSGMGLSDIKSKIIIADKSSVLNWDFIVPGDHQRANLACAVEVARKFNIPEKEIKKAIKNFKGVEGRLQLLKTYKGIKIYNDNNATTPEATIAGLQALGGKASKSIVLIAGGSDKGLSLQDLVKNMDKYTKSIFFIPGTGTSRLLKEFKLKTQHEVGEDFKRIVISALSSALKGEIVLLSPAFASFGMFMNEYDRNDQFIKIIKGLK